MKELTRKLTRVPDYRELTGVGRAEMIELIQKLQGERNEMHNIITQIFNEARCPAAEYVPALANIMTLCSDLVPLEESKTPAQP